MTVERETGRRSESSASITQYVRDVRQIKLHALGYDIPDFTLLPAVIRTYSSWGEDTHQKYDFRSGVHAEVVQQIYGVGMSSMYPYVLGDDASYVFSY